MLGNVRRASDIAPASKRALRRVANVLASPISMRPKAIGELSACSNRVAGGRERVPRRTMPTHGEETRREDAPLDDGRRRLVQTKKDEVIWAEHLACQRAEM